jgi:hypothetical protein
MKGLPDTCFRTWGTLAGNGNLRRQAKLPLTSKLPDTHVVSVGDSADWSFTAKAAPPAKRDKNK